MTKLIPFDRDKYEKGMKVVRRDGKEVLGIFFNPDPETQYAIFQVYRAGNKSLSGADNKIDGKGFNNIDGAAHDLFLEVNTIDLWIGLDDQFICFPSGKIGIHCSTYAYQDKEELNGDMVKQKVKITLDAETLEQV